ncbi:mannosyl-oligosaccharide glucosidase GCS1 [Phthorimaea operculella]|nr:mannosyl-oligosaccharide glucosidase GCS1 [Phthorimaea operculella]
MVRNRKPGHLQFRHDTINNETSSNDGSDDTSIGKRTFKFISRWKTIVGCICLCIAVYVGTLGYLETRVNTPFDHEKVVQETGLAVPERYWGSYRSNVYVGMKSREPRSPVFGLMWYELTANKGVRHWCDQNDNLPSYGWIRHDGESFGEQVIVDPPHTLTTSFVKTPGGEHGGHWTVRLNVTSVDPNKPLMLVWYGALDESLGPAAPQSRVWVENGAILGYTPELRNFRLNLVPHEGKILHKSYSEAYAPGLNLLKEKFFSLLKAENHPTYGRLPVLAPDDEINEKDKNVNFVLIQLLVQAPLILDIVYVIKDLPTPPLKGEYYTRVLEDKKRNFDEEFEGKFKLASKGYSESDISVARAAMSNLVGGIGYFYGTGKVKSPYTREPVPYWKAPLYTAVPSRSFFPRGFLWDEGFHGLVSGRWSPDIQMDIAAHWLDLTNVEGWIPREQILGVEALARVPKEFVVQSNLAANPPMLMIQLAKLVKLWPHLFQPHMPHRNTLERMFTRLQAWFSWFQTSQKGSEPTSYRWRDRHDDPAQLNPKSLSSGLDDYPRASHPSDIERHVDLRCWMYAAADAMAVISETLDRDSSKYEDLRDQLSDEELLNQLHWSPATETYADYGLHTDGVRLVKVPGKHPNEPARVLRSVTAPPQPSHVTSAFGYVSLFPMLLKVLKPESENLGKILATLDKEDLLWSPYGLRSLSKSSPLYMKRNTEHDPPYWRGPIWININYLALAALKHYATVEGPHRDRAAALHDALRENVVTNILNEYKRTGYLWEQYSGETGRGQGCRPFTGWTALLTLVMAEEY